MNSKFFLFGIFCTICVVGCYSEDVTKTRLGLLNPDSKVVTGVDLSRIDSKIDTLSNNTENITGSLSTQIISNNNTIANIQSNIGVMSNKIDNVKPILPNTSLIDQDHNVYRVTVKYRNRQNGRSLIFNNGIDTFMIHITPDMCRIIEEEYSDYNIYVSEKRFPVSDEFGDIMSFNIVQFVHKDNPNNCFMYLIIANLDDMYDNDLEPDSGSQRAEFFSPKSEDGNMIIYSVPDLEIFTSVFGTECYSVPTSMPNSVIAETNKVGIVMYQNDRDKIYSSENKIHNIEQQVIINSNKINETMTQIDDIKSDTTTGSVYRASRVGNDNYWIDENGLVYSVEKAPIYHKVFKINNTKDGDFIVVSTNYEDKASEKYVAKYTDSTHYRLYYISITGTWMVSDGILKYANYLVEENCIGEYHSNKSYSPISFDGNIIHYEDDISVENIPNYIIGYSDNSTITNLLGKISTDNSISNIIEKLNKKQGALFPESIPEFDPDDYEKEYHTDDIVYYNGFLYLLLDENDISYLPGDPPDTNAAWRRITIQSLFRSRVLSGKEYELLTTDGQKKALKDIIEIFGGTVTEF